MPPLVGELTGFLEESSGLFGVLAQIEAPGLALLELDQIPAGTEITVMR